MSILFLGRRPATPSFSALTVIAGTVLAQSVSTFPAEADAYSGDSSFEDGTHNRDGTYSGDEGQSATVEGTWSLDSGGSRALTCIDSTGAVVSCR